MTPIMKNTNDDVSYDAFLNLIQINLMAAIESATTPLFRTDVDNLFGAFLDNLPERDRQHHKCRTCFKFVEKFGGLVTIEANGTTIPVMWDKLEAPKLYKKSAKAMFAAVAAASVTGVFYESDSVWGTPANEDPNRHIWRHMATIPPLSHIWNKRAQTPHQGMAEKAQDFQMMERTLAEFSLEQLEIAVLITGEDNDLTRAEKVRGVAKWLYDLKKKIGSTPKMEHRYNILWHAVATAPAGWSHARSTMIGTLLDDIAAGKNYATIKRNFENKVEAGVYQTPTAAPSAGTIAVAERLFKELGLQNSLLRRYANREEIPANGFVWEPQPMRAQSTPKAIGSLFGHVQSKRDVPTTTDDIRGRITMTWEKFKRTVLPTARQIEVVVPPTADHFMALVTADDFNAPSILQWDTDEERNPFSWYYATGIDAEMRKRVVAAGGKVEGVDVRCSLMWNNWNDLDLHAVGPNGRHIFFGDLIDRQTSGNLDVDMNAGGRSSDNPVENVRWIKGTARSGRYQFFVDLYATKRGGPVATPFSVEIEVEGQVFTFSGVTKIVNSNGPFTGMVKVADFEYRRGEGVVSFNEATQLQRASTSPNVWNVTPGSYVPVTAIVKSPNLWSDQSQEQHGQHAFFLLEGCRDTQSGVGRGFYMEMLQSDLRPVRSVLEAYNATAKIEDAVHADACGIGISNKGTGNLTVRVNGSSLYTIGQWD